MTVSQTLKHAAVHGLSLAPRILARSARILDRQLPKTDPVDDQRRPYQVCTNCVMDTTDPGISFDADGLCDHCRDFQANIVPVWSPDGTGITLERLADKIRRSRGSREFDCILGLSGGVDSSYMLHLAVRELGLRPLVFHVDGGWNSEISVHNISVLIDRLGLDLFTEVIDWNEMRDFQLAFFKSGVPHIDIPQDHAFIATLYNFAERHGVKYILNGGNISTEVVSNPSEFFYWGTDMVQIRHIIRRFGTVEMKTYPFSSIFRHKVYLRARGLRVVKPLNSMRYVKAEAMDTLEREYGWKRYPQKHFESRFTAFFEGYWLPKRFGFDSRRVQLSSLILTGQISRDDALLSLDSPSFDPDEVPKEFAYVAKKLGISTDELNSYFTMPRKYYWDYPNIQPVFLLGANLYRALGFEARVRRR